MSFGVGIDLGTTFTAAAVRRPDGHVEMITLGRGRFAVPSAIFALPDGGMLVGDVAVDRGREEPGRLAIEFKRRLGDSTPLLLGGAAYSADRLTAELLRWTLSVVAERQGGPAGAVVVTHPANWGEFRRDMMHGALQLAGVGDATLITEPEAAALHYASRERVEPGELVAVYDLGGGTFDAVVLERTTVGFTTRGTPRGIERLGGVDLDHIIRGMVTEHLTTDLASLDPSDPGVAADLHDLHAQCIQAKVALSSDLTTTVRVRLADERADVRLTRAEFEERARPTLLASVEALDRTIRGADVTAGEVAKILLVGGSSRIPLIAEMVFDALGRPVAVDTDPKAAVAMGAALTAEVAGMAPGVPVGTVRGTEGHSAPVAAPPTPVGSSPNEPDPALGSEPAADRPETEYSSLPPPPPSPPERDTSTGAPPEPEVPDEPDEPEEPPVGALPPPVPDAPTHVDSSEHTIDDRSAVSRRPRLLLTILAILVVIVVVIVVVVVSNDDDPEVAEPEDDPEEQTEDEPLEFFDLRVVDTSIFPFDTEVNGHQFTSISGIAFDANAGVHLGVRANTNRPDPELIDPEPLLFTFQVSGSGEVRLIDAVELTGPDGESYGLELDAEGLEVFDDGTVAVVSEGHPNDDGGLFVHLHGRDGTFLQSFDIPDTYVSSADGTSGVVNQGFDAVTLVRDRDLLVVGVEHSLAQDDQRDEGGDDVVRLLGFDASSGEAVREWGYRLDPVNEDHPDPESVRGSLLALVAVDELTVLAWERSFAAPGATDPQYALYQIQLDDGVEPGEELPPVLDKRLVWADVNGELTANFDSVSLGEPTPGGETSLVFAGDCRYRECDTEILTVALTEAE